MTTASLPHSAQSKLTAIRLAAADAKALVDSGIRLINGHREREQHLRSTLARLGTSEQNFKAIDAADTELKAVQAEIARTSAMLEGRKRRVQNDTDLLRSIEDWLGRQRGTFVPVATEATPAAGEGLPAAIERVRGEIAQLKDDRMRVRRAPLTAGELKAIVRAKIGALAEKGRARIYNTAGGTDLRIDLLPSNIPGDTLGMAFSREVMEQSMAWLHHDTLVARLEGEIDAQFGNADAAVSAEQKARLEAAFPAMILDLERQEEALIEQAHAAGHEVQRRADASPAAVLGVEVVREVAAAQRASLALAPNDTLSMDVIFLDHGSELAAPSAHFVDGAPNRTLSAGD